MKNVITFKTVSETEPREWGNHVNGGDYGFNEKAVMLNGKKIGQVKGTTAGFEYCEAAGSFEPCRVVTVENAVCEKGRPVRFQFSERITGDTESISLAELIQIIK